ncbi:MAG: hypothetical protein AB7F91_10705 [Parvularculaceae bacterium]
MIGERHGAARLALAAIFAVAAQLGAAHGEDYELVAALGLESDSAFRGARGDGFRPASYGYVEFARGRTLIGLFANPVEIQGETGPLILSYGFWKPRVGKVELEFGGRRYWFPGSSDFTYDFERDGVIDHAGAKGLFEAQAGVKRRFRNGRLHLRAFYTPDGFAETGAAWYVNGEARARLPRGFEARGSFGVSRFADDLYNDDYVDYRIALHKSLLGFDAFVSYSDTAGLGGRDNSLVLFGVERYFTLASSARDNDRRFDKIRNDWQIDKALLGLSGRPGPYAH